MSKYYVWRRNDGYIHASCGGKPDNWNTVDGRHVSFEHLGEFDEWKDAHDLIAKLRGYNDDNAT